MSGLYAVGATLLSVAALALFVWRLGGRPRLGLDAAAAGASLCATVALLFAPFDLLANPLRFAPETIAFGFAGLPEEALKMLGFAAFLRSHWRARSPRDVTLAAGALALGFATLENYFYVVRAGDAFVSEAAARAVTAAPMHVLWGIAGGYVVARAPAHLRGVAAGAAAWLGLAALHGIYDFGYFASRPDAVRFVAFDDLVASLGFDGDITLRVLVDGAEVVSALAAAAALRALRPAPGAPWLGGALSAAGIAGALGVALYGAGAAFAADAWLPLANWLGFALPPLALGLLSLPQRWPISRRGLVAAAMAAACVAAVAGVVWGPSGWRRLEGTRATAQAYRFYTQGDFARAAEGFGRAVAAAPDQTEPLALRALAYSGAKRYADALADLDRALKLAPSGALWAQRAAVDRLRNQPAAARADLDAALALDAGNPDWLAQRAQARIEAGDSEGAGLDLAQANATAPNQPGVQRMTALWDVDRGDFDAALRQFNARLHDDPHDRQALFGRGRVWLYKGEFARARDDFAAVGGADLGLYPALWRYLAQARLHESAGDALKASLAGSPGAWPAPLARMLLGEIDAAAARAQASDDDQRCEADFYAAAARLGLDPGDVAATKLRAALAECPPAFIEYEGAKAALRRLAL